MNTSTAAQQAGVTVATVQNWCRIGAVAARKVAGRWVIQASSLTYRISLGVRRVRKATMIDLTGTFTWTEADGYERTVTPKVRDRARPDGRVVSISGLAPLLADRIDAIADDGDRGHALTVLSGAVIALREEPRKFAAGVTVHTRMDGRVSTTYVGTPDLPVDVVLDLAEQLHAQLV
ncbi:helix-turn-helix domain-containing protein [Actinomadura sp. 3N407]|uniref:helix-turn-helix domain-containing protein n=1 Tax=Actinomadura sp. 3N407 TaxID=3457423 RepID=UPI003FCC319B